MPKSQSNDNYSLELPRGMKDFEAQENANIEHIRYHFKQLSNLYDFPYGSLQLNLFQHWKQNLVPTEMKFTISRIKEQRDCITI